jgi:hypothetical protein
MQKDQTVSEMVEEVLERQAKALAHRSGHSLEDAREAVSERLRSYSGLPARRTNPAPSDSLKNSNQAALHRSFARDVKISTVSRAAS